jgi:hypothetical protein
MEDELLGENSPDWARVADDFDWFYGKHARAEEKAKADAAAEARKRQYRHNEFIPPPPDWREPLYPPPSEHVMSILNDIQTRYGDYGSDAITAMLARFGAGFMQNELSAIKDHEFRPLLFDPRFFAAAPSAWLCGRTEEIKTNNLCRVVFWLRARFELFYYPKPATYTKPSFKCPLGTCNCMIYVLLTMSDVTVTQGGGMFPCVEKIWTAFIQHQQSDECGGYLALLVGPTSVRVPGYVYSRRDTSTTAADWTRGCILSTPFCAQALLQLLAFDREALDSVSTTEHAKSLKIIAEVYLDSSMQQWLGTKLLVIEQLVRHMKISRMTAMKRVHLLVREMRSQPFYLVAAKHDVPRPRALWTCIIKADRFQALFMDMMRFFRDYELFHKMANYWMAEAAAAAHGASTAVAAAAASAASAAAGNGAAMAGGGSRRLPRLNLEL